MRKKAYAKAQREFAQKPKVLSGQLIPLDPYREVQLLPPGMVNGNTLRRTRGERTDEDCINEVCELVCRGITVTSALKLVGVPTLLWYTWKKTNQDNIVEKFEFAYTVHLEVRADEIFDIVDEPLEAPILNEKGEVIYIDEKGERIKQPPPYGVQLSKRAQQVQAREFFLERLVKQFMPKTVHVNANFYSEIKSATTPQQAMQKYIEYLSATKDKPDA
jgi:hypothetical protein